MSDYAKLQSRCQRGEASLFDANNLLAKCHASLGRLIAERDQLKAENERLESEAVYAAAGFDAAREEVDRLKAENETLRKDAERYRWLKSNGTGSLGVPGGWFNDSDEWDEGIDEAMGKGEQG